jgi:hypothetical protein
MSSRGLKLDSYHKELLLERDFEFFLKITLEQQKYSQKDIDIIYNSYNSKKKDLYKKLNQDKKQFLLYLYGQVILQFEGGFLPTLFRFDGSTRNLQILDFKQEGIEWATFHIWQKYERRKMKRKNIWDYITKTGAILAIALTLIKLYQLFFPVN